MSIIDDLKALQEQNNALLQEGSASVPQAPEPVQRTPAPAQPVEPGTVVLPEIVVNQDGSQTPPNPNASIEASGNKPNAMDADYDALKKLYQQTVTTMDKNKETYLPVDENDLPEYSSLFNYFKGFNKKLIETFNIPSEAGNELMELIGLGIIKPGESTAASKKYLAKLGIQSDAVNNMSGKMGEQTFVGLAQLGTLLAAAPSLAAQTGTSTAAYVTKAIGELLQKNPGLAIAAELGSASGGVIASEIAGQPKAGDSFLTGTAKEAAPLVGSIAGAGIGTKLGKGVRAIAEGAVNLGKRAINAFSAPKTVMPEPLIGENFDISRTPLKQFSESQLEGSKLKADRALQDAIDNVPTTGSPAEVQTRMRAGLERAERISNRIVGEYWKRTPQTARIPMTDIRKGIDALRKDLVDTPSAAPTDFMDRLEKLSLPMRGADGRMVASTPTIKLLRDFRGEIRRARLSEEGKAASGMPVNDNLVRNYNRLEGIIDDGIQKALPGDVTIQQARAMSIAHHDRFSRGNISEILARRRRGDPLVAPDQSVERLMSQHGGVQDLQQATRGTLYTRAPGVNKFAVTPAERAEIQEITKETENSIRSLFREHADTLGPEKAAQWWAKNEKSVRPLASVHAELEQASKKILDTLEERKLIEKSALAKFVQSDPDKAIVQVWNEKDPVKVSKELLKTFKGDPDALAAYQKGLVRELFTRGKFDVLATKNLLNTPRFRDLLQDALTPGQFKRLNGIIDITDNMMKGENKNLIQRLSPFVILGSRIFGAQLGRGVAHITGGGTVQTPSIVSESFRRFMEKRLKWSNPQDLMVNALIDPKWEVVLEQRGVKNVKEAQMYLRRMRRMIGALEGERQREQNLLGRPDGTDEE